MSKLTVLHRVLCSTVVLVSSVVPALAMDYEAKPVNWVIKAPIRLVGGLTGAVINTVGGPIDGGYHGGIKGTKHVAGKFGDEKGLGQTAAAVPLGGSVGMVLGGGVGVLTGVQHGFKTGWEKPFSRWSYVTMEEK